MDKETRFCIGWYEQFGWKEAPFGLAEGFNEKHKHSLLTA